MLLIVRSVILFLLASGEKRSEFNTRRDFENVFKAGRTQSQDFDFEAEAETVLRVYIECVLSCLTNLFGERIISYFSIEARNTSR